MRYINELREGEMLSEAYLCKVKQTLKTKAGKSYYSMMLQDKTGTLDAKVWDLSGGIENFEAMDYIRVDGQVTSFQGTLQLSIRRIRKCQEGEYDPSDYMPVSKLDISEMYQKLMTYENSIKEPHLRKLADSFFAVDKTFSKAFMHHSAAKSVHHSFIGGLLEHTLSVVELCDFFARKYGILNRDLLITAALFHDVGKMQELSVFPENDYTDEGQLLGHIYIGAQMIDERMKTIPGFPKKLASELKHCILAHHGELEYGSPKKPAIIEAMALNFADNTDAKMQTMTEFLEASDEKNEWLGFNRLFDSNIKRTTMN